MKIDITTLLTVFDELLPYSKEDRGYYWFRFSRSDGFIVEISVDIYEDQIRIGLDKDSLVITTIRFDICNEVNVLDEKLKQLEIIQGEKRAYFFKLIRKSNSAV